MGENVFEDQWELAKSLLSTVEPRYLEFVQISVTNGQLKYPEKKSWRYGHNGRRKMALEISWFDPEALKRTVENRFGTRTLGDSLDNGEKTD